MKTLTLALSAVAMLVVGAPAIAATAKADAAMTKKCALPTQKKNAKCIAFKKAHAGAMAHDDAMMSDGAMKHEGAMMKKDDAMMAKDEMKADKPK